LVDQGVTTYQRWWRRAGSGPKRILELVHSIELTENYWSYRIKDKSGKPCKPRSAARAHAEAAQREQSLLAERAGGGQDAELDRRVVAVEERAHAQQAPAAQLAPHDA